MQPRGCMLSCPFNDFAAALPSSVLRLDLDDGTFLCTVIVRRPSEHGLSNVTIEALLDDGRYACFTLHRSVTLNVNAWLVLP